MNLIKKHQELFVAVLLLFLMPALIQTQPSYAIPLGDETRHEDALKLLSRNDYEEVIQLEEKILHENPDDLTAYFLLAIAYMGKGDEKMALRQAEHVRVINEKFASEIYAAIGRFYITRKRYHKSLVYLHESLKINEDPGTIKTIASIYMKQGNLKNAKTYYMKLLGSDPDYLNLSRIYLAEKEYDSAIIFALKAINEDTQSPASYLVLGTAFLLTGRTDPARNCFMLIRYNNPEFFPASYFLGLIELIEGNYDTALTFFDDFKHNAPMLAEPYLNAAVALHLKGDIKNARLAATTAGNLDPLNPVTHLTLGNIYVSGKEFQKADREFVMAGELFSEFYQPGFKSEKYFADDDPAVPSALTLSVIYNRAGLYTEAVTVAESAMKPGQSENPFLAISRGRAEAGRGNMNTAKIIFLAVAESAPWMSVPHAELGDLYEKQGKLKKAISSYREALEAAPPISDIRLRLATLYRKDNNPDKAVAEYKQAIEESPESVSAYRLLAETLSGKGELEKALDAAKRGSDINPEDGAMKDTLGWIYFRLGRYNDALNAYSYVMKNGTKNPVVYYHIGMAYMKLKKNATAMECFEKALDIDDEFSKAAESKKMLKELGGPALNPR